jgi:type II secretory ATPase GspE/PulE/Tfp pilus assembly ATPase PilB-like protein
MQMPSVAGAFLLRPGAGYLRVSSFDVQTGAGDAAVEATIADFVEQVVAEAIRQRATDIHLEPYYSTIRLAIARRWLDGPGAARACGTHAPSCRAQDHGRPEHRRAAAPGRTDLLKTETEDYDLRVSVIPTKHGEAICLRWGGTACLESAARDGVDRRRRRELVNCRRGWS